MRKIIALGIMLLFLGMTISSTAEESTLNDDIEIKIVAGYFGFFKLDIGHGLRIWIKNPNGENVTFFFNMTFDYLFLKFRNHEWRGNDTFNDTLYGGLFFFLFPGNVQISLFSITVECEGNTVTREGIWIGNFVILYK